MSGFVTIYNKQGVMENPGVNLDFKNMFRLIQHRGPDLYGKLKYQKVLMAQNYLKGDVYLREEDRTIDQSMKVPVVGSNSHRFWICYDGQVGNCKELCHHFSISEDHFQEERLFLQLYAEYGPRMFEFIDDAIFAFIIFDGKNIFSARDLLGIKPLFYGHKNGTLYFASELKCLVEVTDYFYEFPPGHYMDTNGQIKRFAELPKQPSKTLEAPPQEMTETIRDIISRSFVNRVDFKVQTGNLLSGGIDSSVIACLASKALQNKADSDKKLQTFAVGVEESEDVKQARLVASHINSEHHELIVGLDELLDALPQVIWHLESFDPSLVRSAVSNYLISKYAKGKGIEVILSGEGGDELFCGYRYLKDFSAQQLFERQMECLGFLHNNASLRLDRMNLCHSIKVVAPLISGELMQYALKIPIEYKLKPKGREKIEKWIFRKAFEKDLPAEIVWRTKQEFSQGSGSANVLTDYFEKLVRDDELELFRAKHPMVRSKEELYYFRIFTAHFGGGRAVDTVGQWISL